MRLGTGSLWPGYISYNGEIEGNTAIFPKGTLSTSFFSKSVPHPQPPPNQYEPCAQMPYNFQSLSPRGI